MEYEYLFTKGLHEKLKEKIKGKIFCKVIEDVLVISIDTKEDVSYNTIVKDFADKLRANEISADSVADDVVKKFRRIVLDTFFYY